MPARRSVRVYGSALALLLSIATRAAAQSDAERARATFESAQSAYTRGEYSAAAEGFEAAYRLAPHGGALFAAAVAWEKAGQPARAADAFADALASGELPDDKRTLAQSRLDALAPKLGRLEVEAAGDARVSVAHVSGVPTPRSLYVEPGSYVLSLRWPDGRHWKKTVRARPREVVRVRYDPPTASPATADKSPPAPASAPVRGEASANPPTLAWIAFGGAAVLGGTGAFLLARGLKKRDEFDDGERRDEGDRRAALELRTWSTVSFVGAAALAVTGVVLVLDAGSSQSAQRQLPIRATAGGPVLAF